MDRVLLIGMLAGEKIEINCTQDQAILLRNKMEGFFEVSETKLLDREFNRKKTKKTIHGGTYMVW